MALLPGFLKGQSDNLPKMDSFIVFSFLGNNPSFMGAEIRGFKAQRSGREDYGDNAVGYVQVKRDGDVCTVHARVTPEHNVKNKAYSVELQFNEKEENILSVQCKDCAASLGGCKHSIALLMWLHRRSEEPPVTSVTSYWKKSRLSCVGSSIKLIKGKDLVKNNLEPLVPLNGSFRAKVVEKCRALKRQDTVLTKYSKTEDQFLSLSIHRLVLNFFASNSEKLKTADKFLDYAGSKMTEQLCLEAIKETVEQSASNLWFELRYARITASKAYEAAHCHTMDGSLVETILGAKVLKDNAAMARGRKLEKFVRKEIEKRKNIKIKLCGFKTHPDHPILGASPDGMSDNYAIEIKCPSSEKNITNYIKDGKIGNKYYVQMQLQMFFFKKSQALFCVAATDFEKSKDITILVVDFDENLCKDIIKQCTNFWKTAIFPVLKNNFD